MELTSLCSETREQRALDRWDKIRGEWDRVEKHLAMKFGKDSSTLIMRRSGAEFRAKQEEIDMIDAAMPAHLKNGSKSWEMSLRCM